MSKGPQPGFGFTKSLVIEAYKELRSFAAISYDNVNPTSFTVTSSGAEGPPYNIQHLDLASAGGEVRGSAFTANSDGTISVNKDMFACSVDMLLVGNLSISDNVVLGVCVGSPSSIPNEPGVVSSGSYVSRFRYNSKGEGINRETTWLISAQPIGKSTTELEINGLKAGDKIFPVLWTQESSDASLFVVDLIMSVEEISV